MPGETSQRHLQLRGFANFQRHNPVSTQLSADVRFERSHCLFGKQRASDIEADSMFCTTLSLSWCSIFWASTQAHVPLSLLIVRFADLLCIAT